MKATTEHVPLLAGVSLSAVSCNFTDGASLSPSSTLVTAAPQDIGYAPNALAPSLSTGRT